MNTTQQAQVHEMLKLLSMQALSGQTANGGYNQLLLAMLQMQPNAAAQHIQAALLHAQAVQQHMLQVFFLLLFIFEFKPIKLNLI